MGVGIDRTRPDAHTGAAGPSQSRCWQTDRLDLRLLLARALTEVDDLGAIVELLAPHAMNGWGRPELAYLFGRACARTNDAARALPALRCAVDAGVVAAHGELAWILIGEGAHAEALAVCRRAFELAPADAKTMQAAAHVMMEQDAAGRLLDLCQMLWERGHRNSQIPAVWAVAAAAAGRQDEARRLVDRDRWFAQRELAVDAEFNPRLADEILRHRMSVGAVHSYYSTRGDAIRVWTLEAVGGTRAQQLVSMIRDESTFMSASTPPSLIIQLWQAVRHASSCIHGRSRCATTVTSSGIFIPAAGSAACTTSRSQKRRSHRPVQSDLDRIRSSAGLQISISRAGTCSRRWGNC